MPGPEPGPLTSSPSNTLIIMLNGASDEPIPEFGNKTPLQSADKPLIDTCASYGSFGRTDARKYTHLFLLELLTGKRSDVPRGLIDAAGLNVRLRPNQVAYRFNPATINCDQVDWTYRISGDVEQRLHDSMIKHLSLLEGMNPQIYFYSGGRGVLAVEAPYVECLPSPPSPLPLDMVDMGSFEDFIRKLASDLDGLTILPWGGGMLENDGIGKAIDTAKPLLLISKSPSTQGIGRLLGIRSVRVDAMWSGLRESIRFLSSSNVLLHIDDMDEIGHKRSPLEKVAIIEEIDLILRENVDKLRGHRIALLVDHGTSSLTGEHLLGNVPFCVSEVLSPQRSPLRFCEDVDNYVPLSSVLPLIMEY